MFKLDINALHRAGKLREGAVTDLHPKGGCRRPGLAGQKDVLVTGLGVLVWRGQRIEWVHQPIICRNPPPSWGASTYRYRPKFLCPRCGAGAYQLYLRGETFACCKCAGVEYPSREPGNRDALAARERRILKLRAKLEALQGRTAPRSRWLFWRTLLALRLEQREAENAFEAMLNAFEQSGLGSRN